MIKAILFDFDGTMSNRQVNAYGVFEEYLAPYFKDMSDIEYEAVLQDLMISDCNGSIDIIFRLKPFVHKYGKYLPSDFIEVFTDYYMEYMWKHAVLKPNALFILDKLRKDGYKLGLLSNGDAKSQYDKINYCKLPEEFDEIIVTGDYGISKPNPEIFKIMANKLGVKPEECIYIGDTFSTDILGAIKANMIPVWITQLSERPANRYKGYRIEKLEELLDIVKKENNL